MDRYGEAIEADLHATFGVDLLDFFRGVHSWRKLQVLIDKLPSTSHLSAARVDDEEMATRWLEANGDAKKPPPTPPPWTDLTYESQLLMAVVEGLEGLTHLVHGIAGGKSTPPKPLPRPKSALDRVKHRQAHDKHVSLVAEVNAAQDRWEATHG